jgi:hypothetical protein
LSIRKDDELVGQLTILSALQSNIERFADRQDFGIENLFIRAKVELPRVIATTCVPRNCSTGVAAFQLGAVCPQTGGTQIVPPPRRFFCEVSLFNDDRSFGYRQFVGQSTQASDDHTSEIW